jgi:hypothetical protein
MWRVRQSRKVRHVKRNAIIGFRDIAGMMTVSAEKLTANKQKECQQLAPRKHKPDGTAFILLSSPLLICVLSNSRKFISGLNMQESASPTKLEVQCVIIKFIGKILHVWTRKMPRIFLSVQPKIRSK